MNNDEVPVAYDNEGRPLYLHPPKKTPSSGEPAAHDSLDVVQVTRSTDPVAVAVSPEMQRRHQDSKQKYPFLNLSDGEYVVLDVTRHPIGVLSIWLVTGLLVLIALFGWWFILMHPGSPQPIIDPKNNYLIFMMTVGLSVLCFLFGWAAVRIYQGNRFFLTNESVIQEIQNSLISQKEQTINLENIKDVSFDQHGFASLIFGYGSIRLSTEGDEQEYNFTLVENPRHQVAIISNIVEAVKYGRPVDQWIESIKT